MRAFGSTWRREMAAYFASPMAYAILTAFLFLCGIYFWYTIAWTSSALEPYSWDEIFGLAFFLMVVIIPFATGRLLAEEYHRGTAEILFTAPVREWQIVLAKYLAAVSFWAFLLLWTVAYPLLLSRNSGVDAGALATHYLGLLLGGAAIAAMGTFLSALAPNQLTAGVLTFVVSFLMMLGRQVGRFLDQVIPDPDVSRIVKNILAEMDFYQHALPFAQGILDVRHGAFFVGLIVLFLLATTLVVEAKRWK